MTAPALPIAPAPLCTLENCRRLTLCMLYIGISAVLIRFNKFLMTEGRFPYSMALTAIHMSTSSLLCLLLYLVRPSLFPGLASSRGKQVLLLRWFCPIGMFFAVTLYASNAAYQYCSVSFLQFMKESNVIFAFLLSCAVGLQMLTRTRLAVIIWVIAGSALAVTGEVHFAVTGFFLQLASGLSECCRAIMGETVLRGAGLQLDALSYTMLVAPACLLVLLTGNALTWSPDIPRQAQLWWHYLVPNALIAFALNVAVAAVIKEMSAVGFMLAGLVKDISIVLFSCFFFEEVVTPTQAVGFTLALVGVFFWSYLKAAPDSSTAAWAERLLGGGALRGTARAPDGKVPTETSPLSSSNKA